MEVPQLTIMIIYNSTWLLLCGVNLFCGKNYHMNKRKVQKWEENEVLRNCAFLPSNTLTTTQSQMCWSAARSNRPFSRPPIEPG